MSTYFPFLRGKQNELFALRALSNQIAASGSVYPIIEPVNENGATRNSFDNYVEAGMPFVFITNPRYGEFRARSQALLAALIMDGALSEYDNFIPAIYIYRETGIDEINRFRANYGYLPLLAVIYCGVPASAEVRQWCATDPSIYYHVILAGVVPTDFINEINPARRVMINDYFRRQARNADYPPTEFFTDMNTPAGNPNNVNWGDYSIVGDYFAESGGAAYSVAVHHIHYTPGAPTLNISHFISDRQETSDDPSGKTIEAVTHLVENLGGLLPNDTDACNQYRTMVETEHARGLGFLKRLAILHHLEIFLEND
ncbi:MAG: sce7725 family protein [Chthoniobacteraceae bacterium]